VSVKVLQVQQIRRNRDHYSVITMLCKINVDRESSEQNRISLESPAVD